mgnify:CR=1 FL=1
MTTDVSALKEPSMFDLPEWTGVYPEETKPIEPPQRLVGVRFQRVGKVYHYNAQGFDDLKVGDWVIVDTARGKQMGQVATLKPPKDKGGPYKRIERRATGRDMAMRHYYESKELEAMIACRAESAALNLPIKIVRAEYSFDGQTLTFLYSSDQEERVEVGAQFAVHLGNPVAFHRQARRRIVRPIGHDQPGVGPCFDERLFVDVALGQQGEAFGLRHGRVVYKLWVIRRIGNRARRCGSCAPSARP